jgi:hypothetical protein
MRCGEKKGKLRADIDTPTLQVQGSSYALSLASSARVASAQRCFRRAYSQVSKFEQTFKQATVYGTRIEMVRTERCGHGRLLR